MRFDSFTIFLIVLIVFVVIILLTKWISCSKEGFVQFHSDITTGSNIGQTVHIPQYSVNDTNTVVTLYDSLYFDYRNGTLIEIFSPTVTGTSNDVIGSSITQIAVSPRDGAGIVTYSTSSQTKTGVGSYSTPQSLVTSIDKAYNQFQYTSMNTNTEPYQVFYISWYKTTYLHLVNLSSTNTSNNNNKCGSNLYTYTLNNNGVTNSTSGKNLPQLPDYSSATNIVTLVNSSYTTSAYLKSLPIYKIATSAPPSGTSKGSASATSSPSSINVSYDISNGNIVIDGTGKTDYPYVYNRSGNGNRTTTSDSSSFTFTKISSPNVFIITDLYPYAAVLVIANQYDTIVSIITPSTSNYTLLTSVRFNRKQIVTNIASDSENNGSIDDNKKRDDNKDKDDNKEDDDKSNRNDWKDWEYKLWKKYYSNMDDYDSEQISKICGNDVSCKWYWYFNQIGNNDAGISGMYGKNILSDDYFLKTEVVPPVCPQCPMCPDSGICGNCGGQGGSGTCNATNAPTLTPSPTIPGTFKDGSGNIFVLYTDSKGNKNYVPLSSITNTNLAPAGSISTTSQNATAVDANGQFVTTADPNTIGGGLAVSTMSLDQLGTSAFNNTGAFANNVVNTAGNLAGGVIGLAGTALGDATSLAKGVGNGIMQLGSSNGPNDSNVSNVSNGTGVSATGPYGTTSDKTFGNIPGKTPIDNYSYYGALQSKGANYMPVTADFSSFRK